MTDVAAVQKTPFEKRWTSDDDNILFDGPPADRRKPRTYASLKLGFDNTTIPLDFCLWLQSDAFYAHFDCHIQAVGGKVLR